MRELNEESRVANEIKQNKKILVVVSNPPYSGTSVNKSRWIQDLLKKGYAPLDRHNDEGYFTVDGKPLGEKNPKWLQDDYVKFFRFAQWKIDMSGEGVVGYITNHGYLDNPTFRGMRQSLLSTFNRIFILNLHGNTLKQELSPDGTKDENIFDIQQGVAIAILVKDKKLNDTKVMYSDLFGTRDSKFEWLDRNTINSVRWQEIIPRTPNYLFVPQETSSLDEEYQKYPSIPEIFKVNSVGIVTARDDFVISWSEADAWNVVSNFAKADTEEARSTYNLGKDARDWKVSFAQKDLIESGLDRNKIIKILYRPFDERYTYYTGKSRGFHCMPRPEVSQHMIAGDNIGLIFHRREELDIPYSHFLITDKPAEHCCVSIKTTCYLAPLYLLDGDSRKSNIDPVLLSKLEESYEITLKPEHIFYYIYAIVHSRQYRQLFRESLKRDFPRIPFVKDKDKFLLLSGIGQELSELHLGRKKLPIETRFDIPGTNVVQFVKYDKGRISINNDQFFEPVKADVWDFQVGSYKVLEKWLKSRKNRELTSKDIEAFLQIIELIKKTNALMNVIEKIKIIGNTLHLQN
jgi:predicted helicase